MCPEPSFEMVYRALIETYRLTPETVMKQMDTILDRFLGDAKDSPSKIAFHTPKGGIST